SRPDRLHRNRRSHRRQRDRHRHEGAAPPDPPGRRSNHHRHRNRHGSGGGPAMTARRATSILRGLLALVITLLLLVGVPVGLILSVGWPLPTSIPTADALSRAMQIGISDEFVVNALTVIVWI